VVYPCNAPVNVNVVPATIELGGCGVMILDAAKTVRTEEPVFTPSDTVIVNEPLTLGAVTDIDQLQVKIPFARTGVVIPVTGIGGALLIERVRLGVVRYPVAVPLNVNVAPT
jgi:hypothetical protein